MVSGFNNKPRAGAIPPTAYGPGGNAIQRKTRGAASTAAGKPPPPTAYGPGGPAAQRKAVSTAPTATPPSAAAKPPPPTAYAPKPAGAVQRAPARAGLPPPPTLYAPGGAGVQRLAGASVPKAGHGAPATPFASQGHVIQRVLEITSTSTRLETKNNALKYLTDEYRNYLALKMIGRGLTQDEAKRVEELAEGAENDRLVYPIPTLVEAMAYIETGAKFDSVAYDLYPDRTPTREYDDSTPWRFTYFPKENYNQLFQVPQSPVHYSLFEDQEGEISQYIDLLVGMDAVKNSVQEWSKLDIPKCHKGNNHYAYSVKVTYRMGSLRRHTDLKSKVAYAISTGALSLGMEEEMSLNYTSRSNIPAQDVGERKIKFDKKNERAASAFV